MLFPIKHGPWSVVKQLMDYLSTPLPWWVKALWNSDKLQDSFLKIQHQQIIFEVNFPAYFFW